MNTNTGNKIIIINNNDNIAAAVVADENVDVEEFVLMREELHRLRRDRDHWRNAAIANLAMDTSNLATTCTTKITTPMLHKRKYNRHNTSHSNNNRKRDTVNDNEDDGTCSDSGRIDEEALHATTMSTIPATSKVTIRSTLTPRNKEELGTDTTSNIAIAAAVTTTIANANKRQKIASAATTASSKDDNNYLKSVHFMVLERHLNSAMIYAKRGDEKLMLHSIKLAENKYKNMNIDVDTASFSSSSHSSSSLSLSSSSSSSFLNKINQIKETMTVDLEQVFYKKTIERQLRSAMSYAIRGDTSMMEYLLKEAESNARKCGWYGGHHNTENKKNDSDNNDSAYEILFQERISEIRNETSTTYTNQNPSKEKKCDAAAG